MAEFKKLKNSVKTYVRREKARIRRERKDLQEQKEQILRLYERIAVMTQKKPSGPVAPTKVVKQKAEEKKES